MRMLTTAAILTAILVPASQAQAIGCVSGAIAGGVAGHYAGHHAVLGAMGGCAVGHHLAVQKKRERERRIEEERRSNPYGH